MNLTLPKRYLLSLLAFFGFFNALVLRSNLSIAIIPMVKSNTHLLSSNTTTAYNWDLKTQGFILSAFFYSYALVQIPAGFLATTYGGKILFGGSVGLCGFLTLFTPICAYMGSGALITLRVCEGFASGFVYPSLHAIWSKWAPKDDKAKLVSFALSGSHIGTLMTMLLGGVIATYWSWEWIFYLSGILALLWTAAWFYLASESPATHPTISKEEASYIESNLTHPVSRNYTIPWRDILTSLPVWAIMAAHFGANSCMYIIFTEFPTFLTQALGYQLDQAGLLAAIPWLALAILLYVTGLISDRLAQNYATGYVRKLVLSIAFIVIALTLLCATLLPASYRSLIVISITIAIGSCGLAWASFGVNHLDIGAHFAGVLMGLSNCVGSIPGIAAPTLTGYIVENPTLKREWNIIFMLVIVICIFALMFYSFFASGDLQSWATTNTDEYQHVLNNPISSRDVSQGTGLNEHNLDDLTDRIKAEIKNENEDN